MDLANGRVLRDQQSITTLQLRDISQKNEGTIDLPVFQERKTTSRDSHISSIDLLNNRGLHRKRRANERVVEAEIIESNSVGVSMDTQPVQRRHGVGRLENDATVNVENEEAVTHSGCADERIVFARVGKRPLGDHLHEPVGKRKVGLFELEEVPSGLSPLSQHHTHRLALMAKRCCHDFCFTVGEMGPEGNDVLLKFPALKGLLDQWTLFRSVPIAYRVVGVERRCGRGTNIAEHDEDIRILDRRGQHEDIAESEVSK